MKAVLISIQPKWCELIASGKKTVEVRKTKPKLETPLKCYIYETNWHDNTYWKNHHKGRLGKVIGEFVCDKMLESFLNNNDGWFVEKGCLTQKEIDEYQGDKAILYGWHISDLVIYDKPKELREFHPYCDGECTGCKYLEWIEWYQSDTCMKTRLKRPPQSWCYVEELKGE